MWDDVYTCNCFQRPRKHASVLQTTSQNAYVLYESLAVNQRNPLSKFYGKQFHLLGSSMKLAPAKTNLVPWTINTYSNHRECRGHPVSSPEPEGCVSPTSWRSLASLSDCTALSSCSETLSWIQSVGFLYTTLCLLYENPELTMHYTCFCSFTCDCWTFSSSLEHYYMECRVRAV